MLKPDLRASQQGSFAKPALLACVFYLLSFASQSGASSSQRPELLPPVNDEAIRVGFEERVSALMEEGKTVDVDELLEGLKSKTTDAKLPEPETRKPLSSVELYRKARAATLVFGRVYDCGKCERWHGSLAGVVLIDPSGIAITNYHVMDERESGAFAGMNAAGEIFPVVEILAASEELDLAVVRLAKSDRDFPFVSLSDGDPVGTEVRVVSHPGGRFYTLSEGIVARYFVDPSTKTDRIQITADYARGSSGSGVFNPQGQLTGVVSTTSSIYYSKSKGIQRDLQMVVKSCIPVSAVKGLFVAEATDAE